MAIVCAMLGFMIGVRRALAMLAMWVILLPGLAYAGDAPEVERARDSFREGASLAKDAQWGAALVAFERSSKLRPHPWTTYNIAVCERALGQYVRARRTFARALEERRSEADLPDATVADIRRFQQEIAGLVSMLDVHLEISSLRMRRLRSTGSRSNRRTRAMAMQFLRSWPECRLCAKASLRRLPASASCSIPAHMSSSSRARVSPTPSTRRRFVRARSVRSSWSSNASPQR
jgi:hypothetical protein